MTFKLNRRSKRQLRKLANTLMDNTGKIERSGNNFDIWGEDKLLGTAAVVGVRVNKRGHIDKITSWSVGLDQNSNLDNQMFVFLVDNPQKTVNWFSRAEMPSSPILADMTNPQLFADLFDAVVPGLAGGPLDVYVKLGPYTAWS